jgi:hypothetical protein
MAYVPNILKPGYAPAWQNKKADQQHEFETSDGNKYILYVPSSNQFDAYDKSLKKYKDIFNQIKTDVKDNAAIAKSRDELPKDFDHFAWAEILCLTFKKLNKTWGVNDKIWIRNKNDDGTKYNPVVLAITPVTTQRNAKRGARKVSASLAAGSEFDIDANDIEFGPSLPSITQSVYVRTKNGLKYYYHTETDADKDKHFMIKNEMDEVVDEDGNKLDPDGDFRRFVQEGRNKSSTKPMDEYAYKSDHEHDEYDDDDDDKNYAKNYDYNDGNPPYEGAMWDDEFQVWTSDPIDYDIYDEEGNFRNPPEDIIVESEPAPMTAVIQETEKSRKETIKDRMRQRALSAFAEKTTPAPMPMPPSPPLPSAEDLRIVEARIGLPSPWEAYISKTHDKVYYFNTTNGEKLWDRPTMGGKKRKSKTTRKRSRSKTRSKKNKSKRVTYRRKRTTKRRI